ncbi:MAG: GreA/GreB family elongation factor [Candidatus Yanofskybacteria bacterium]|nr:GreA/GreB family elongation factor [Candidatus Yanofskybacteria bacterium]
MPRKKGEVMGNAAKILKIPIGPGTKFRIVDMTTEREDSYVMVNDGSYDGVFRISDQSPLGKALRGKKVGDIVSFTLPNGKSRIVGVREVVEWMPE